MTTMTSSNLPHVAGFATKIDDVLEVAKNHRLATSDRGMEVFSYDLGQQVLGGAQYDKPSTFISRLNAIGLTEDPAFDDWKILMPATDGDLRNRLRVMFAGMMRPAQVAKFKETVTEIVAGVFDETDGNDSLELMADIVWKVPSRMYCNLVSAPYGFAPKAAQLSDSVLGPIVTRDASRRQESIDALYETYDIVSEHIERRRSNLGDDFTSHMIRQELDGKLSNREMVWNAVGLLHASIDNTVQQMGIVLAYLLDNRDIWDQLVADPDLIPAAVEEAMRLAPRFKVIFRVTREDVELDGHTIPSGTEVFVWIPATNRDPVALDDPDQFRLDRPAFRTLLFGGGIYNCLGQHLARLEIQETVRALVQRYPSARLAGEPRLVEHGMGNEMERLDIVTA
jgi:cytochrome P450